MTYICLLCIRRPRPPKERTLSRVFNTKRHSLQTGESISVSCFVRWTHFPRRRTFYILSHYCFMQQILPKPNLRCPDFHSVPIFKNQVPIREFCHCPQETEMEMNKWTFKDNWLPKCPPVPPSLFFDNPCGTYMVKQLGILWISDVWQRASTWKLIS